MQRLNCYSRFKNAVGANARRAFTLIELLVVIAIISLLSSVVLASLSNARESARDTRRMQDINQIRTAIEMYINANGQPPFQGVDGWYQDYDGDIWLHNWDELADELEPHIDPLPIDPIYEDPDGPEFYTYTYRAGGSYNSGECSFDEDENSYMFLVRFESASPDNLPYDSAFPGRNQYCVIE